MNRPLGRPWSATLVVVAVLVGGSGCVPDAGRTQRIDRTFLRLAEAEDARPTDGRELTILRDATASRIAELRRVAVRGLGRLESPDNVPWIEPLLDDPAPSVREAAANALAQAVVNATGSMALPPLLERLSVEEDPSVRGTLARSMGRLRLEGADRARAERAIVAASRVGSEDAPVETLSGVALGLEAMVRADAGRGVEAATAARLMEMARHVGRFYRDPAAARIRTLSYSALGQARRMTADLIEQALRDEDAQVGAVAMRHFAVVPDGRREELLRRAAVSRSPFTVIEALRFMAREPRTAGTCRYLIGASATPPPAVAASIPPGIQLVSIDALSRPCPDLAAQLSVLRDLVGSVPGTTDWQPAAHALVALASLSPADMEGRISPYVSHASPFVRAYAARAAEASGRVAELRTLADDDHPNVRTAAITGLAALAGHTIDDILRRQLLDDDPQLLMTAAGLLSETPDPTRAATAAVDAFERISRAERETWRDPRLALLALLRETGDASMTDRLSPYLLDYDEAVAMAVAETLRAWNGRPYLATAVPLPPAPLPTADELAAMADAQVVLHMGGGGTIVLQLHPYEATTNTYRFYRLARAGYYDGLTFHRWAPNFVIQGGSPGANEYQGDGPYTRDEVGLRSHWRGTVGISTRGHDTGDGQIFVNLMDNVRLDHAYTIIGTVVEGMEVVDRVLEGSVIERVEIRPRR